MLTNIGKNTDQNVFYGEVQIRTTLSFLKLQMIQFVRLVIATSSECAPIQLLSS